MVFDMTIKTVPVAYRLDMMNSLKNFLMLTLASEHWNYDYRFRFLFMIEHVMPLCLTISWVYTVAMLVQSIVYEKEQRLKEAKTSLILSKLLHLFL